MFVSPVVSAPRSWMQLTAGGSATDTLRVKLPVAPAEKVVASMV